MIVVVVLYGAVHDGVVVFSDMAGSLTLLFKVAADREQVCSSDVMHTIDE